MHYGFHRNINQSYDIYKLALKEGANCNDRDSSEATPFHGLLKFQSLKIVNLLLDCGADITTINMNGETALHCAVCNPYVDVTELRLDRGMDIECKTNYSFTASDCAAEFLNPVSCELLLGRGAIISRDQSKTPLKLATNSAIKKVRTSSYWGATVQVLPDHRAYKADKVRLRSILKIPEVEDVSGRVWYFIGSGKIAVPEVECQ